MCRTETAREKVRARVQQREREGERDNIIYSLYRGQSPLSMYIVYVGIWVKKEKTNLRIYMLYNTLSLLSKRECRAPSSSYIGK